MIIPDNITVVASGAAFKAPKDRAYDPYKDYCWGVAGGDKLFGNGAASRSVVWTLTLKPNNDLILNYTGNTTDFLLGNFPNTTKVSFAFDKDMFPIVALNTMKAGGTVIGTQVLKFTGLSQAGTPQMTEMLWLPTARSPSLALSYDWDPGSINNQPVLVYIETAGGKHILRMRSYADKFVALRNGEISNTLQSTDYVHRCGLSADDRFQIEYARITI